MTMTIDRLYLERCNTSHNIDQHLPILREYASRCDSVVELGTDIGFSTTAFLSARPQRLDCYDLVRTSSIDLLEELSRFTRTQFTFHQESTLTAVVPECDLLFVDTEHTAEQVTAELRRHAHKAKQYLVFHDVVACPAIVPAIWAYINTHPEWRLDKWLTNQSGLAIFSR